MSDFTLKDFIEKSLSDICEAVDNARLKNPSVAPLIKNGDEKERETSVNFDIAVTLEKAHDNTKEDGASVGGGFNINVFKAEASMTGEKTERSSSSSKEINKLSFSVPVYFQYDSGFKQENSVQNKNAGLIKR